MKKALCIGINHFQIPGNDLSGCVPDALQMSDILKWGRVDSIQTLTDGQATKLNAMLHLASLVEEAKAGKLSGLSLTWSGHGTHYPRPEEPDGLGEALVCYDIAEAGDDWDVNTIIKDVELKNLLNQVPTTCTVEVWLDTCYSGGMDRAFHPGVSRLGERTTRFLHNPDNKKELVRTANSTVAMGLNSNVVLWCACSEEQTSEDAWLAGGAHGAFTYFWCKSYKRSPRASRIDLLLQTRRALQISDYDQFPRLKAWNKKAQAAVGS